MNKKIKKHYEELFREHGCSPKAAQWSGRDSQFKRFEILTSIDKNICSILDVGCGMGDMYEFLSAHNYAGEYLGIDFVPDFIKYANYRFGEYHYKFIKFQEHDIAEWKPTKDYDYVLLSGVFNNKMSNNKKFMLETIEKMFKVCSKGIAFNSMSTYVDYQDDHLYYSDPLKVFDFCKRLTHSVTLKHDYVLYKRGFPFEYTMYLYRSNK